MELAHRWLDRNLSRMELVVAWMIIVLFFGFFMRYMLVIFAKAERTMVETSIVNINSSLKYHAALAVIKNDEDFLYGMKTRSPYSIIESAQQAYLKANDSFNTNIQLKSLITVPDNYLGELYNPDPAEIDAGLWYYDLNDMTLNYRVRNSEFFYSDLGNVPLIKFKLHIEYNDVNENGIYDEKIDEYNYVELRSVGNYSWVD